MSDIHAKNVGSVVNNPTAPVNITNIFNDGDKPSLPSNIPDNLKPEIKLLFDSLKDRYQKRYESKLDGRFEITLEVRDDFDSLNSRSITEQFGENATKGIAIEVIREAFEKKGRLLIVGNPGVGKTVLLLKLAIDLLDKIKDLEKEPFPVIFNLASWSEEYKNFGDWLNAMLVANYGFYKRYAKELLKQGKIIFLLDGLDELGRNEKKEKASEKRAKCLASLNEYLRDGRRAVISCRAEEFKQMKEVTGQDAPVSAKVEVFDLSKAQVLLALEHAKSHQEIKHHASAENLLKILESEENNNLLEVLSTPFYFTTAMEVYDQVILTENKLPETIEETKKYLIATFVEAKIKNEENPNEFEPNKTIFWLRCLAWRIKFEKIVTFELSTLQMYEEYNPVYEIFFFLISFVAFTGICFFISYQILHSAIIGFTCALGISIASFNGFRPDLSQWSFKPFYELLKLKTWGILIGGFGCLNFFVWLSGIIVYLGLAYFRGRPSINWYNTKEIIGETFSMTLYFNIIWIAMGVFGECYEVGKFDYIRHSYQRLRSKFLFTAIVSGFICYWGGFLFIFLFYIVLIPLEFLGIIRYADFSTIEENILLFWTISCLFAGFFSTPLYRHFIVRLSLYIEGKMPLKYATFLDYAASLRILEKDGGQWRFRHQNLQEYFVKSDFED